MCIRDSDNAMFDANELDEIESRLEIIYRLSLKYGETEEEMLSFLDLSLIHI